MLVDNKMPKEIEELINSGALFVINDSGGKDSQAMKIFLSRNIPNNQLVIIHAELPGVDWPGLREHIERYSMGIPVKYTKASKTFFEMVDRRKMFPSPKYRQCTSDLKRGPIQRFINNYARMNGFTRVVNCMGLRAEESSNRAKKEVFSFKPENSTQMRTQFEWLPIHKYLLKDVFDTVESAGQELHHAYLQGMTRLSCCFCIMASDQDLTTAAILQPELYAKYVSKEKELNFSMIMPKKNKVRFLEEITGINVKEVSK